MMLEISSAVNRSVQSKGDTIPCSTPRSRYKRFLVCLNLYEPIKPIIFVGVVGVEGDDTATTLANFSFCR